METVSSGTPAMGEGLSSAPSDEALAAAFRDLRSAIARREKEHARRERDRAIFARGMLLVVLGIFLGLWALAKTFDVDVFKAQLQTRITDGAPGILRTARSSLSSLEPIYRAEVQRTYPAFSENLANTISQESGKLAESIAPLARGDASIYTGEADAALAKLLLNAFGKELHNDFGEARQLAVALRNQQILAAQSALDTELAGPFGAVRDMQQSLTHLGPPDKELLARGDTVDTLGNAALDVVKARLASGEGFGFGEPKVAGKTGPKAGGK